MFQTGQRVEPGQFSCEKVAEVVADYVINTCKLSDHHWKWLMDAFGVHEEEEEEVIDEFLAQQKQCTLYVLSSSTKDSGEG